MSKRRAAAKWAAVTRKLQKEIAKRNAERKQLKKYYRIKVAYLLDQSVAASSPEEAIDIAKRLWVGEGWIEGVEEIK